MSCTVIPLTAAIGAGSAALSRWYDCYNTQIDCKDLSSYATVGAITGLGVGILIVGAFLCCSLGERKQRKITSTDDEVWREKLINFNREMNKSI